MTSHRSGSKPVLAESNGNAAFTSSKGNKMKTVAKKEDPNMKEGNEYAGDEENFNFSTSQAPNLGSKARKRKAEEEVPDGNEKEGNHPIPPIESNTAISEEISSDNREKTPGRDGPIKEEDWSLKPDIKPFKGEPGRKVRKTAHEKNEEYRQFARENEGHVFHELYVCFDKGPNGSPTYDKSGFQLDYHKVADWMKPKAYNKSRMVKGMSRALEKGEKEDRRMAELFFEKGEAPTEHSLMVDGSNYWKDRVSKDLNIPWHKIGVREFEEWDRRGFKKARRGDYEHHSEAEKKRMMRLISGASLRK